MLPDRYGKANKNRGDRRDAEHDGPVTFSASYGHGFQQSYTTTTFSGGIESGQTSHFQLRSALATVNGDPSPIWNANATAHASSTSTFFLSASDNPVGYSSGCTSRGTDFGMFGYSASVHEQITSFVVDGQGTMFSGGGAQPHNAMMTHLNCGRLHRRTGVFPLAFWLFFTPLLMCAQPTATDPIVVQSDMGPIYYRMIGCGSRVQPVDCHPLEQQRLHTRIKRLWIAAAAKEYGIVLTPADETDVTAQLIKTHAFNVKTAAHYHSLAVFAFRIRSGERNDSVYTDAVRSGITASEIDGELDLVPTREVAERQAQKDFVADLERSTRDYYTERVRRRAITTIVQRQANQRHTSFAAAEERFWSDVIANIHMRLTDETYQLPSRTGVLEHE